MLRRWSQKKDSDEPADHALGRSRGGFSTKLTVLCDAAGIPLHFALTPGQTHETQVLEHILNETNELLANGTAAPVVWPEMLAGDKDYRAEWVDTFLLGLGIKPVIPSKANEDRDKRAHKFDSDVYRRRNIVERLVGWLKENRRLFSRFEKSAKNFGGMIRLAFVRRYLRLMCG